MRIRSRHPNKEIEAAIQYAEKNGWRCFATGDSSHAWGGLLCPFKAREGCRIFIFSTPRNAFNHAQQICRAVSKCKHVIKEKVSESSIHISA